MSEKSLQNKTYAASVVAVAGLGMAGMGLVSSGIVVADTVTDTINVTVQPSCTFNSVEDKTYIGSAANGTEVDNFNDSGIHEFNLFCNDNNGYIVTATPYDLEANGIEDVIAYTDNYTHTGVNSMWTAVIESDTPGLTVTSPVPIGGGTIISSDSSTTAAGADFTATYSAYVGTATPAGTYTGTIIYTLTASGTSNNGNSGTNGGNSGSGTTNDSENADNNGGSGTEDPNNNGGNGTGGTGNNGGTGGETTNNSSNNTPSNAPLATNNTYNSYSTTNTYNTTNYTSGSGAGTTSTPVATTGNTNGTTGSTTGTGTNSGSTTGTSNGYEKPLGVTTNTSSTNEESGIDWVPIAVTAGVLATAGIAAVALAKNNKEEDQQ